MSDPKSMHVALVRLWANAAFLPLALAIEMWRYALPTPPTDDADSGAPEGADVVRLDQYREANNGR